MLKLGIEWDHSAHISKPEMIKYIKNAKLEKFNMKCC